MACVNTVTLTYTVCVTLQMQGWYEVKTLHETEIELFKSRIFWQTFENVLQYGWKAQVIKEVQLKVLRSWYHYISNDSIQKLT